MILEVRGQLLGGADIHNFGLVEKNAESLRCCCGCEKTTSVVSNLLRLSLRQVGTILVVVGSITQTTKALREGKWKQVKLLSFRTMSLSVPVGTQSKKSTN